VRGRARGKGESSGAGSGVLLWDGRMRAEKGVDQFFAKYQTLRTYSIRCLRIEVSEIQSVFMDISGRRI